MNIPTDQQLKVALAKMLPEKLFMRNGECPRTVYHLAWRSFNDVSDSELLQICWEIQESIRMSGDIMAWDKYLGMLESGRSISPWQFYAEVLAEVKEIEL